MIAQLSIGHISASVDTDDVIRRLSAACVEMFTATCEAVEDESAARNPRYCHAHSPSRLAGLSSFRGCR